MAKPHKKDIIHFIDSETVNKVLLLTDRVDCYEGVLLDNYIIWDASKIKINRTTRKFIILKERFLNEWSSDTQLIMTDDEDLVNTYVELFEEPEECLIEVECKKNEKD